MKHTGPTGGKAIIKTQKTFKKHGGLSNLLPAVSTVFTHHYSHRPEWLIEAFIKVCPEAPSLEASLWKDRVQIV